MSTSDLHQAVRTQAELNRRIRTLLISRTAGADITPGHDELHHFWTRDPRGLSQWADSPKPWTTLVALLTKHVGPERARVFASRWVHDVFHQYTGSDAYRLEHGGKIRGKRVGPG